jgi:hypothetical protein
MSRARFLAIVLLILAAGTILRAMWLRADPPAVAAVGTVWHDEGPWVHNARNQALWGVWRTDNWNPVFVAPVFTALEYVAFRELGVGTWQARVVPVVSGLAAILLLIAGLAAAGNRQAAVIGGALLATDYVFVMWNRAALMESTMTAFMVVAWACYALAGKRPVWGAAAGAAAMLAFFTKAAAAFFIAAIVIDALYTLVRRWTPGGASSEDRTERRAAAYTLAGLAGVAAAVGLLFVLPHWREYYFYNVTMSVLRKPSYGLGDFIDRASWLPVVQDFFTRMWPIFVAAVVGILAIAARWRTARPAERLLVLWVLIGLAELVVHDSGNARRYVMFIPAVTALAALTLGRAIPLAGPSNTSPSWRHRLLALPLLLWLGYLVAGSALQPVFHDEIAARRYSAIVMSSTVVAIALALLLIWKWRQTGDWLRRASWPRAATPALVALAIAWNAWEYAAWARHRGQLNYEASVALGQTLPEGTLIQGKLANGLALDNRIRPIFIGNGFGNYEDRLRRDDVRYILTYELPQIGYESQAGSSLIPELLEHYPERRVVARFDVDETPAVDRAILIDKRPR